MNNFPYDAAAHQLELERQRWEEEQELLRADPAYDRWLEQLNRREKVTNDEIPSEGRR